MVICWKNTKFKVLEQTSTTYQTINFLRKFWETAQKALLLSHLLLVFPLFILVLSFNGFNIFFRNLNCTVYCFYCQYYILSWCFVSLFFPFVSFWALLSLTVILFSYPVLICISFLSCTALSAAWYVMKGAIMISIICHCKRKTF